MSLNLFSNSAAKPKPIRFQIWQRVTNELKRLEELKITEKARGPTPWVTVYKNNCSLCVCLDSRVITTAIERERCPIPTIDDLIVEMNVAFIFSKLH
jgi:hypothetical protein